MNNSERSISKFIRENLNTNEGLPFETKTLNFKKKSFIKKKDELETNVYYLVSGIVEVGKKSETENSIADFYFENDFFCDAYSLFTGKISNVYIQCLTDCTIEQRIKTM